jgi:hypothetical protein
MFDRFSIGAARTRFVIVCLALIVALSACKRPEPAAVPVETAASAAPEPSAAQPLLGAAIAQVAAPAAAAVLSAIYGEATNTGDAKTLADGRQAAFWYGYRYRSGGQERYTAFAFTAKPDESGFPAPDERVALARITYTLDNGAWRADAAQTDVGEFGGLGRAPEIDTERAPLLHEVSAARALLGVPTTFFATGATIAGYELFAFDAEDGRWRSVGDVKTGEDHSASCTDGPSTLDTACVRNTGILRFQANATGAMPVIVVSRSGSARGDDGVIRALSADDTTAYRYDPTTARYVESSPAKH